MFVVLLSLHSIVRWLVVIGVLARLGLAVHGLATERAWGKPDRAVGGAVLGIVHTQVLLGIGLLATSPLVQSAMADMKTAMADPNARFFTVEHTSLMLLAAVGVTVAHIAARRAAGDANKHRIIAIGFGIAVLVVLAAMPWPFREAVARPWL